MNYKSSQWYDSASTITYPKVREDNTAIDNYLKNLIQFFPFKPEKIKVSGINSHPRREFNTLQNLSSLGEMKWLKSYAIGLYYDVDAPIFKLIKDKILKNGDINWSYKAPLQFSKRCEVEFKNYLPPCVKRNFTIKLSSKGYISFWQGIQLIIGPKDLVVHCSKNFTTKLASSYTDRLELAVIEYLKIDRNLFLDIYQNKYFRYGFFRELENKVRGEINLHSIGSASVSQTNLYMRFKKIFKDAHQEVTFNWLGRLRLDIYIPSLKVAIEYHGPQHYQPVEFFGGEKSFNDTLRRDKIKKDMCIQNDIRLLIWPYWMEITDESFNNFIDSNFK